jgi:hypothetical protein
VSRRLGHRGPAPLLLALLMVMLMVGAPPTGAQAPRTRWDTRVIALIPTPGYPARAYVAPNGRIYEGTYDNPLGDTVRSRVLEYTGDGTLQRSWTALGQNLTAPHGVQVATSDGLGRLVLLDRNPARALLLNTVTGEQTTYATFPDLPTCAPLQTVPNCSPALRDEPPVPDYAAWGPDGSLYVTDFQQAVIWRLPPHGGTPSVWLADRRLDGDQFGTTGIVLAPDRHTLFFTQQSSAGLGGGNPATGKLYAVTIQPDGTPGAIRQLWESAAGDGPDGFTIARSGRFYIALAGSNQIVVVGPDGHEVERFPTIPQTGANGSSVPFDTPSSAMFLGTRLIVANQSYFAGNTANMAILDVETGEVGAPEFIPAAPSVKKSTPRARRRASHRRAHHRRRPRFTG